MGFLGFGGGKADATVTVNPTGKPEDQLSPKLRNMLALAKQKHRRMPDATDVELQKRRAEEATRLLAGGSKRATFLTGPRGDVRGTMLTGG